MDEMQRPASPTDVAAALGEALEERGQEYAFGGAIALGYWGEPRGTLDVDLTVYLPPEKPTECIWLLQEIGCEVPVTEAVGLLQEHGFCRATYASVRVDVFTPTIPFYEAAKLRRRRVPLKHRHIMIWDPETLAVFKMMFFREKDIIDLKQILRNQGAAVDRTWVRRQLAEIYTARDARIARWDELVSEFALA